jgi:hypothetical protein
MKMRTLLAAAIPLLLAGAAADAKPRQARCVVQGNGVAPYRGPCRFLPDEKGSFAIEPVGRRAFPGGISVISLWVVERGVGEVRGLTSDGINSRWGTAHRSRRHRACWIGSDFSLCVY